MSLKHSYIIIIIDSYCITMHACIIIACVYKGAVYNKRLIIRVRELLGEDTSQ